MSVTDYMLGYGALADLKSQRHLSERPVRPYTMASRNWQIQYPSTMQLCACGIALSYCSHWLNTFFMIKAFKRQFWLSETTWIYFHSLQSHAMMFVNRMHTPPRHVSKRAISTTTSIFQSCCPAIWRGFCHCRWQFCYIENLTLSIHGAPSKS